MDKIIPKKINNYLELIRLNKPIGFMLLLWPCWFSLAYIDLPENKLIKIPENVDQKTAAAIMLKGMTVEYLTERTFSINASHSVLLHAAAGGVGQIFWQWELLFDMHSLLSVVGKVQRI